MAEDAATSVTLGDDDESVDRVGYADPPRRYLALVLSVAQVGLGVALGLVVLVALFAGAFHTGNPPRILATRSGYLKSGTISAEHFVSRCGAPLTNNRIVICLMKHGYSVSKQGDFIHAIQGRKSLFRTAAAGEVIYWRPDQGTVSTVTLRHESSFLD